MIFKLLNSINKIIILILVFIQSCSNILPNNANNYQIQSYNETTLNNLKDTSNNDYISTVDKANRIIRRTIQDECTQNTQLSLLSKVRVFVTNFVIVPLQDKLQEVNDKSIYWDLKESDLTELSVLAKSLDPNLVIPSNKLDDECKDKQPECKPEDFQPQPGSITGKYISDKTIKCRICARPVNEQIIIKNSLDIVNNLRLETERTSKLNENANKERVFGYIKVFDSRNPNVEIETIKGINGVTTPSGFAPVPSEPRRYSSLIIPVDEQGQPDPTNDTEIRMLEDLAKRFYAHTGKYKQVQSIEIEEFTDRKPCRSCSNVLDKVETVTPEIKVRRFYKLGIYESGEWIPIPRANNYYSLINCNN